MSRSAVDRRRRSSAVPFQEPAEATVSTTHKLSFSMTLRSSMSQLMLKAFPRHPSETENLRPCQQNYLAVIKAKGLFKRSTPIITAPHIDPIFCKHAANAPEYKVSRSPSPLSLACRGVPSISPKGKGKAPERAKGDERDVLLRSINDARTRQGVEPLQLNEELSYHLQHWAESHLNSDDTHLESKDHRHAALPIPPTAVYHITSSDAPSYTRLISPPGLGAPACSEPWCGQGFKRHDPVSPSEANFVCRPKERPCDGRKVYDLPVAAEWETIGVACSTDGTWVADLAAAENIQVHLGGNEAAATTKVKTQDKRHHQAGLVLLEGGNVVEPDGRRTSWETIPSLYSTAEGTHGR